MRVRKTTKADIRYVLRNLSRQNAAELRLAGLSRSDAYSRFRGLMAQGSADTAVHDGRPACILGLFQAPHGTTVTWFIATDVYFSLGAPAVLHARRYMVRAAKEHGRIETVTLSPHPDVRRWFELLGFTLLVKSKDRHVFEYVNRSTSPIPCATLPPSRSNVPEVAAPGP